MNKNIYFLTYKLKNRLQLKSYKVIVHTVVLMDDFEQSDADLL